MNRERLAADLEKLSTVLGMAVAALERLADELRRPDEARDSAAPPPREETAA